MYMYVYVYIYIHIYIYTYIHIYIYIYIYREREREREMYIIAIINDSSSYNNRSTYKHARGALPHAISRKVPARLLQAE